MVKIFEGCKADTATTTTTEECVHWRGRLCANNKRSAAGFVHGNQQSMQQRQKKILGSVFSVYDCSEGTMVAKKGAAVYQCSTGTYGTR